MGLSRIDSIQFVEGSYLLPPLQVPRVADSWLPRQILSQRSWPAGQPASQPRSQPAKQPARSYCQSTSHSNVSSTRAKHFDRQILMFHDNLTSTGLRPRTPCVSPFFCGKRLFYGQPFPNEKPVWGCHTRVMSIDIRLGILVMHLNAQLQ